MSACLHYFLKGKQKVRTPPFSVLITPTNTKSEKQYFPQNIVEGIQLKAKTFRVRLFVGGFKLLLLVMLPSTRVDAHVVTGTPISLLSPNY